MPSEELSQIRQNLLAIKQELEDAQQKEAHKAGSADVREAPRKHWLLDFGMFLVAYLFWLVVIVSVEVTAGLGVYQYTCLLAVPLAWLTLCLQHRAPLRALLVTVCGVLFLASVSYLVSFFYDAAWSSNCYYKPVTGMLMYGWNPFEQTMVEFTNAHNYLPYNAGWLPYQVNNQPKASFMIGASFYALTGNIESGKIFNIVSFVACVSIAVPLMRDAFKISVAAALVCALLVASNLITVSQLLLFYNDGFAYQLLTIAAVSFFYILFKPKGAYVWAAKLAAFMAICLAINVKMSALLYAAVLIGIFVIGRVIALQKRESAEERNSEILRMIGYFAAMTVFTLCVLGATTYITNQIEFGNPFYGMLGDNSMNTLLPSLMSDDVQELPLYQQFFVSMFSPTSNTRFTEISLKIPFTFSQEEWTLATSDANVSGWGILFSGIFCVSILIVVVTAIHMFRHDRRVFWHLLALLAVVILPIFVIPYLFCARYYLQPFWVPLAALVCLFGPSVRIKKTGELKYPLHRIAKFVLAPLLCATLILNAATSYNYLAHQYTETRQARNDIAAIQERLADGETVLDVSTIEQGLFYGLLFNLNDAGIPYNFAETVEDFDDGLLHYLVYAYRDRGPASHVAANNFLRSLYKNTYLIVVASHGGTLTPRMQQSLQDIGLMPEGAPDPLNGYIAIVNPDGKAVYEHDGFGEYQTLIGRTNVLVQATGAVLAILINDVDYAYSVDGYNIVVYDTLNDLPVASVTIDLTGDLVMRTWPVRGEAAEEAQELAQEETADETNETQEEAP